MPIAVQGELTEVCPARVATSLGPPPAAIHRATAVCRRSWMRSPSKAGPAGGRLRRPSSAGRTYVTYEALSVRLERMGQHKRLIR
jgi:hypothetical protein